MKKEPLSRRRILQAALELIDGEGLEGLSMRRVGQALQVEAMSLYHHVKDKAALLDGVYELILEPLAQPPAATSWVLALKAYALAFREALQAHPHAMPLFASRPAFTPASLAHVEGALALLRRAGFSPPASLQAFNILVAFVVGHALSSRPLEADSTNPDYSALDAKSFPHLLEAAPHMETNDLEAEFELGLDLLLKGLRERMSKLL